MNVVEVDMNVVEPCIRCCENSKRSDSVSMYLAALKLQTRASPPLNICINSWPHKTSSDETLRGMDSQVREGVQDVKHRTSEQLWHVGAWCTGVHVTEQGDIICWKC